MSTMNPCDGVDAGSTILGDFVLNSRAQDPSFERELTDNIQARTLSDLCFYDHSVSAKVWFAPDSSCNENARDLTLQPQHLGNIHDEVCRVWSDRVVSTLCSFRTVSPQPDEHTYGKLVHIIVFHNGSPAPVLVKESIHGANSFCACALPFYHPVRKKHELRLQRHWSKGELVHHDGSRHEKMCSDLIGQPPRQRIGKTFFEDNTNSDLTSLLQTTVASDGLKHEMQNRYYHDAEELFACLWGNTATHAGDESSTMQTMTSFASMVGQARFDHAVENQCSIYPIADYTRQNFIKQDILRRWLRGLPHGIESDTVRLAVWKVEMKEEITHSCKYLLLDESNWSRQFRNIWRGDFSSSTPEIAVVVPQPPMISHAEDSPIHVIAIEHNRMPSDQVIHLYDVWRVEDLHQATGREFLARKAVRTKRHLSIRQIAELLGLTNQQKEQSFYALHRSERGDFTVKFRDQEVLGVPDFSYVDLIVYEKPSRCETLLNSQEQNQHDRIRGREPEAIQPEAKGDNTATPGDEGDFVGLMQTAAQISEAMCFEPVRTPIQLNSRGDPSWRLWNHFAHDRMRNWFQLDEMSVWFLAEGTFIQSIPLTLFSSRQGSPTSNDPIGLWESLGGNSMPIVLMVFPNPDPIVIPFEHLLFLPLSAYDEGQRAFVIDVIDRGGNSQRLLERVAVRGLLLTPRKVAQMLGYVCRNCRTLCKARKGLPSFVDDQEIRYPTGSYLVLFVSKSESRSTTEGYVKEPCVVGHGIESDEVGLYQFMPPPRQGSHGDSERYFWVRNTVIYQPALLDTVLSIGIITNLHWPLFIVHLDSIPVETRTFGFEAREQIAMDDIRVRFRELYADQFRTDGIVSIGPVGLDLLQFQRTSVHTIHLLAFRERISLTSRPVLIWIRFLEERQIETRAALTERTATKTDMLTLAGLSLLCLQSERDCRVIDDVGTEFLDYPVRVREWSRIKVYVSRHLAQMVCQENANQQDPARMEPRELEEDDHIFFMQNMATPVQFQYEYDMISRYTFSHEDMFYAGRPIDTTNLDTYCHLWRDRAVPRREHQLVILRRAGSARQQLEAIWARHISPNQLRLVPVRPVPDFGLGPNPVVLALDYEDEHVIPVLYDFTSDDRVFTGTGLIDCTGGFPEVRDLFDHLVPDNRCRTETSCIVRANGRQYVSGQRIMLYEGILLRLDEEDLDATTTDDVASTEYEAGASHESTPGISSNASMQPLGSGLDAEQSWSDYVPLWATTGPFFDRTSEGQLFVVDHDIEPALAMEWFEAIATQRTVFQQIDQFLLDYQGPPTGLVLLVVGSEWHNSAFLADPPSIRDHLEFMGALRYSLFDEFPVHVLLDVSLVVPNLHPNEQYGASDKYLIVDYDCPQDQVAIVVIISDPEEPDLERSVIRTRRQMTNLLLYIHVGKTAKCTSVEFQCTVEHADQTLPAGSYWPAFNGMKLNIAIQESDRQHRQEAVSSKRACLNYQGTEVNTDFQFEDERFNDESSLMHLFTQEETEWVETSSCTSPVQVQSHAGILSLHPKGEQHGDLLRSYIHARKGQPTHEAFTVYVWMLDWPAVQVSHTAQRCPMHRDRSYTLSLLQLWAVAFDIQPLAVTLVHPDLQPLSLRAVPIDLIVLPESNVAAGKSAVLLDVVGMPLPRRLALFLKTGDTVRTLADLAGAKQICDLSNTECVLRSAAPDNRQEWSYDQVVTAEHGSGLTLWIQPKQNEHVVSLPLCPDAVSFMQRQSEVLPSSTDQMYLQAAVRLGYMHVWVHNPESSLPVQTNHRRIRWDRVRTGLELQKAAWLPREADQLWRFQTVWPFPWMGDRPQPTLIFYRPQETELWPILLQTKVNEVRSLYTMTIIAEYSPTSVEFLFDSAIPEHQCRSDSLCKAVEEDIVYNFWVDVPIHPGAFVELEETRREPDDTSTTTDGVCEQGEESIPTDDDVAGFTQLDIQTLRFMRCHETGRPLSTRLRAEGLRDYDRHWEVYEQEMFQKTEWHRSVAFQREVLAMGALSQRGAQVYILWFGATDTFSQLNVRWQDEWAAQTGMTTARAEIRLLLWDHIPPEQIYLIGTATPQPTTRQQNDRDDLFLVGQLENDSEVAVLLVINYNKASNDRYLIRAVKTQAMCSREILLRDLAMTGMCQLVRCVVADEGLIWNEGEQHPVFPGKRIDVDILFDEGPSRCHPDLEQSEEEQPIEVDHEIQESNSSDISADTLSLPDWANTATQHAGEDISGALEEDDSSLMQTEERLYPDDGRSQWSEARLQRCTMDELAWLEPLRLRPVEMQRCWDYRKVDYVKYHFARQHSESSHLHLTGWKFRSYSQNHGDKFAWGLTDRSPWHEQVSHLMKGTMEAGLLYTVVPQPLHLKKEGGQPTTMQLLVPFQFDLPKILLLVVEHSLTIRPVSAAIICHRPCTVFGVYDLLGLSHWCDDQHTCVISYNHGDCSRTFTDLDQLMIPTASRVVLEVLNKDPKCSMPQSAIGRASHQARRVADLITSPEHRDYQRVFKSARRVLMHRSNQKEETDNDESLLMQHPERIHPESPTDFESGPSSTESRQVTMSISSISSGPPPLPGQYRGDIGWHQVWQRARRHVTEYGQAEARRQIGNNLFVHLLVCRRGDTRSFGTDCPDWILDSSQPLHPFTRWCLQFCRVPDVQSVRAFPVCGELYQNIPSLVVTEQELEDRVPIVVHIQVEQTNMLAGASRVDITHNGRRVQGGDDVHFVPGSVLRIRALLPVNPALAVESTGEPTLSLEQSSHHTWNSLSSIFNEADGLQVTPSLAEHTLDWLPGRPSHSQAQATASARPTAGPYRAIHSTHGEEEAEDEVGMMQGVISFVAANLVQVGAESDSFTESHAAAQIHDLTWSPEEDPDWISMVVRRSMAFSFWEFARCIIVMRPDEQTLQTPWDVRAVWEHPEHFDLSNILWRTWPDLNHIRFSLHEVRSKFRLDQKDDTVTVLIRPHRWGSSPDARIVDLEVIRLQWGNLISRQTAVLSYKQSTPRMIAELCRIRDCSISSCEAYLDGRPTDPDLELEIHNGDLLTVVVSNEPKHQWSFRIGAIPFQTNWDTRRWRSQEQVFLREGAVLVFRPAIGGTTGPESLHIQAERWYNWDIIMRLVTEEWTDFRYGGVTKFNVHEAWRACPEFQSNLDVVILMPDPPPALTRIGVIVCRDLINEQTSYWSQVVDASVTEVDIIQLCGKLSLCQQGDVLCDPSWNGRSIRFAQQLLMEDGDILMLDMRRRQPFCQQVDIENHFEHETATIALLQTRACYTRRSRDVVPFGRGHQSTFEKLPPPGNPIYWFIKQLDTMSRYIASDTDIYIVDDIGRRAEKVSLVQCLGSSVVRPVPTPTRGKTICPDLSTQSVSLFHSVPEDVFRFSEVDRPVWNPDQLELDDHIRMAAQHAVVCQWNEDLFFADALELYTDGSFDGSKAGWAVVVVAHWQSRHAILGTCSGAISEGLTTELGVEIPKLTAQVAEQVALVWGHWWILRFAKTYGWQGQVYFRWDSIVPGKQALGDYNVQTLLGQLLRSLAIALEQQQGDTHIYHAHVRAHRGILLNEIADSAAKLGREMTPKSPDGDKLANLVKSIHNVNHIWWMFCDPQYQNQLPAFSRATGVLNWSTHTPPASKQSQIQESLTFGKKEASGKAVQCRFRFASYNVLSLLDPQPPPMNQETGRARLLRDQVQDKGIHLLGLQECRSKAGAVRSHTHFRLCSGAETNGTLGVELWISIRVPVQENRCLDAQDFAVLHADPRCLLVHYDGEFGALLIIVAHAPHTGHSLRERSDWWYNLNALVHKHRQQMEVVSLIDANATWAGPATSQLGELCEVGPNGNTSFLADFVEQMNLFAPSTFADCQWGSWFTWTHAQSGKEHRIDYVLFPCQWAQSWVQAWTDASVTVGHAGIDHVATLAEVYWEQGRTKVSKKARYDREAILRPDNRSRLFEILDQCPKLGWGVNASDHAVTLSQYLQKALAKEFPAPKNKSPKYTTDATKEVYQKLVTAKRASTQFKMVEYFRTLSLTFRAWAKRSWNCESREWLHRFNCELAKVTRDTRKLSDELRVRLRKDRAEFLAALAQEVNECPPGEIFKKLRPILKPAKKQSPVVQPLPKLVDADGNMILSRPEQEKRWTEHFASIEAGHVVATQQFVSHQLRRQSERCKPSCFSIDDLPTLATFEAAIRSAHREKATGPDGLPAEILKAIPGKASKILYPLALKLALRIEEPITWKGGYLFPLYKGKGAMSECSNHRGILLMDVLGKITRAGLRKWINAPYLQQGHPMQLGGKPHQQAQFGAQLTRSFLRWRKACNRSAAVLFVDIASAFYKALREVATGADVSDQDIASVAHRLGLGPEVMPALHEALKGRSAYASVPRQQVLQESLSGTWFSVDGNTLVATEQGTRPGDSWADVVFNVLLSRVLVKVQQTMESESLTTEVPIFQRCICPQEVTGRKVELLQVTWADDIAMLLSLKSAEAVWSDLPRVTQVLVDELHAIGMEISCGVTKTAALVLLKGKGSIPIRRKLFRKPQAELPVLTDKSNLPLPLVPHYKHLGGILTFKGTLTQEIAMRYAKARQAYWRAARTVFRPVYITTGVKTQLFRTIVMSVFSWGIGAWPALSAADHKKYTVSYWNLWRLCLKRHDKHLSKGALCSQLGCSEPDDELKAARARHYITMLLHAPDPVWSIVHLDSATATAYQEAIQWVHAALKREKGFVGLTAQEACRNICTAKGPSWKAMVKRASERWRLFRLREHKIAEMHRRVLKVLLKSHIHAQHPYQEKWQHYCLLCKKGFAKKNAWFLHASVVHSYRTMEGEAVTGTVCWCCAKQYPSTLSLKHHLRYSQSCCTYFWKNRARLTDDGENPRQRHPQLPWSRTGDPEVIAVEMVQRDKTLFRADLHRTLKEFVPPERDEHFVEGLADAFVETATRSMPIQDILATLKEMATEFEQPNQEVIQLACLKATCALENLLLIQEQDGVHIELPVSELERERISIEPLEAHPSRVFPEVYILHLFSGRRRTGDLQEELERLSMPEGATMFVISLDVMVSATHGDLTNLKQQEDLLKVIHAGAIAAAFAGPPCETWSVARFQDVPGPHKSPRPLRTSQYLWGLVDISYRKSQQIEVGNDLMGFAALVMLGVAISGGFAVLEHPLDPRELRTIHQDAPSVWRTALMSWLKQAGLFHELRVLQGHYGAKSPKPTYLLIAGLPHSALLEVEQVSRTTCCPNATSIGRCDKGWATSSLKEYPKDFCSFLARLFDRWLQGATFQSGPEELDATWLKAMHLVDIDEHVAEGPDYHPLLIQNSPQQGAESSDTVRK